MKIIKVVPSTLTEKSTIGLRGSLYGIPILDGNFAPLPMRVIQGYVKNFLLFKRLSKDIEFEVDPKLMSLMKKG